MRFIPLEECDPFPWDDDTNPSIQAIETSWAMTSSLKVDSPTMEEEMDHHPPPLNPNRFLSNHTIAERIEIASRPAKTTAWTREDDVYLLEHMRGPIERRTNRTQLAAYLQRSIPAVKSRQGKLRRNGYKPLPPPLHTPWNAEETRFMKEAFCRPGVDPLMTMQMIQKSFGRSIETVYYHARGAKLIPDDFPRPRKKYVRAPVSFDSFGKVKRRMRRK